METFGQSSQASPLLLRVGQTGTRSRSKSQTSNFSSTSSSSRSSDQFVLCADSISNDPVAHTPMEASTSTLSDTAVRSSRQPRDDNDERPPPTGQQPESADTRRLSRSRPIAIELPALNKINTAPVYTPLSARGDIPGGYFPLHEDPNSRVHRPHPFHPDANRARHRSISLAAESSSTMGPRAGGTVGTVETVCDPNQFPLLNAISSSDSRSNTAVTSYLPTGTHDSPLPMGKYYPSNYENRGNRCPQQSAPRPPATAKGHSSVKSDTHVPRYRAESPHVSSSSEAERRLRQYQRDMMAQTTLAASEVLAGVVMHEGSCLPTSSLTGLSLKSVQLSGSMIHKPASPQLLPLGSPGPVTPMDLEEDGNGDGYLTRGRPSTRPDEEVSGVIQTERRRQRREGLGSPGVKLGPVTF